MVAFLSILFGGSKKTAKQARKDRRQNRRLRVESLEPRQMLAGGVPWTPTPIAVPSMVCATKAVPVLDIMPGVTDQVLADFSLLGANSRQYGRLEEVLVLPAFGSEVLSWNTQRFVLRADLDGRAKTGLNGCEAIIATAVADQNDIVDFVVSRSIWVRGAKSVHFQITADFNGWLSGSDNNDPQFGIEVAQVMFRDMRNIPVPDGRVRYVGAESTMHTLNLAGFGVSQRWQPETSVVYAGAKDVSLLAFDAWANWGDKPILVQNAEFVAAQGNLANCGSYSLWTTRWQQEMGAYVSTCLQSGVSPLNGKVSFTNGGKGFILDSGYQFEVRADAANTLADDPTLSLTFGSGWKARELNTGKALRSAQMRFYTSQSPVFNFKPAPSTGLYVSEVKTGYGWEVSAGAKDLVMDVIDVYAKGDGAFVTQVVVAAAQGDLANCTNYTLWWKSNGVSCILAMGNVVDDEVVFDFRFSVAQSLMSRLEVHADMAAAPVSNSLRLKTTSVVCSGSGTGEIFDVVDSIYAQDQATWTWQLPSKSPTDIENLLAQIADLQAQLLLQGNG